MLGALAWGTDQEDMEVRDDLSIGMGNTGHYTSNNLLDTIIDISQGNIQKQNVHVG